MFQLHHKLAEDTWPVLDLKLCKVLLMKNAHYPWLILVPMRENCRDLFDVPASEHALLWQEIRHVHEALKVFTNAEKMNVGALGNMVPQLHIHIIARHSGDAAWPAPVWGGPAKMYDEQGAETLIQQLKQVLKTEDKLDIPSNLA
ncbi:MAG: hypothetical protein COY40_01610 [Alphaproteobacteria bacterium CG_4_10_14_0_8_um_filter_53_9]|nr:MAG: hypothetical protein COY40_01610 [Alphaproteobacteria bacterium CG_4_10_14_0_8_um_filter_53_9]